MNITIEVSVSDKDLLEHVLMLGYANDKSTKQRDIDEKTVTHFYTECITNHLVDLLVDTIPLEYDKSPTQNDMRKYVQAHRDKILGASKTYIESKDMRNHLKLFSENVEKWVHQKAARARQAERIKYVERSIKLGSELVGKKERALASRKELAKDLVKYEEIHAKATAVKKEVDNVKNPLPERLEHSKKLEAIKKEVLVEQERLAKALQKAEIDAKEELRVKEKLRALEMAKPKPMVVPTRPDPAIQAKKEEMIRMSVDVRKAKSAKATSRRIDAKRFNSPPIQVNTKFGKEMLNRLSPAKRESLLGKFGGRK